MKTNQPNLFGDLDEFSSWKEEWKDMPEFIQHDLQPYQKIILNFETKEDVEAFAKLINQKITYRTDTLWFPMKQKNINTINIYVNEP
jgi:hypothetical protein